MKENYYKDKEGFILSQKEIHERRKHLQSINVRNLLKYLNYARKFGGKYDPITEDLSFMIPIGLIKEELQNREHMPNKQEAKEIRRKKQMAKNNAKERRKKYGKKIRKSWL